MNPGRHNPDDHDNSDFKPDAPFGYPERKQPPLDGELEDAIDDALNADEKMKDEGEGPGFSGEASVPGTESSAESSSSSNSDDEPNVRRNSGGKGERKRMIEGFTKITVRGERNIPPASRGDGESFPIGLGQTPLPPPPGFPAPGGKSCMIAIADAPTGKKATHSAFTVIGRVVWSPLGECGELPMDTCESAVQFTLNYEKKADHLREKWKKGFYQMRRLSPEQVDHFLGK